MTSQTVPVLQIQIDAHLQTKETTETTLRKCFTTIIYQRILCLTEGSNFCLISKGHSLNNLMLASVFHKVNIHSLMSKWRDTTKRVDFWDDPRTRTTRVNTFHGLSMHRIYSTTFSQDLHQFSGLGYELPLFLRSGEAPEIQLMSE